MSLLTDWREEAYSKENTREGQMFWANYFNIEKGIYEQILATPDTEVKGTVKELAEVSGKSIRTINRIMSLLKAKGLIERIGSNKNGYWKVK